MDPRKLFVDSRHALYCVYCGNPPETIEHAPAKVFLDDPLPANLPVVGACAACNNGYSRDEEYVAVALECAAAGSTEAADVARPKIARKLRDVPSLGHRLSETVATPKGQEQKTVVLEHERVERVILKLARGHAAFEFGEPMLDEPESIWFRAMADLSDEERSTFESPPPQHILPEIGSRAFLRGISPSSGELLEQTWQVVQDGRYRYLTSPDPVLVRLVIGEYLAAEVRWS